MPFGATLHSVTADGQSAACASRPTLADVHVDCRLPLADRLEVRVRHTPGWEVLLDPPAPARGERSSGLKLLTRRLAGDTLVLQVEGLADRTYHVEVRTPAGVKRVTLAVPAGGSRVDGYTERELRVTAQP